MQQLDIVPAYFEGAVSFERTGSTLRPWRLPFSECRLFEEPFIGQAGKPAGVRVRMKTHASQVGLLLDEPVDELIEPYSLDLVRENEILQTMSLNADDRQVLFDAVEPGAAPLEIWLSHKNTARIKALLIGDDATVEPCPDKRQRWITYGSSISQCGAADSPALTWPAVAARAADVNLTCLGYGGNCHLDPMVARMIRDLPADMISLKLGINVQGGSTLSSRTFPAAVIGLVKIIREKHVNTPIAVISPIVSPPREKKENANLVGLTLPHFRAMARDCVTRLQAAGDPNIKYFNGLELFDEAWIADYLPDNLHPNSEGYGLMGRRFAETVMPWLLEHR